MFTRLYLHIPFCRQKCPYCAFYSQELASGLKSYPDLLLQEMRQAPQNSSKPLESIYFGGGTPSLLEPDSVATLVAEANRCFGLAEKAEITLEANPGTVDLERLKGFRSAGINRLSLGVQSMDDRMLAKLGRIHTSDQAREAFSWARKAGFENVGIDLMHALPGQDCEMWSKELEQALQLAPEHFSIYGLTVEDNTPFAEHYPEHTPQLPDEETAARMFEIADQLLTAHGYEHYEIANYARPGCRSSHNSGYWQRDGYLGLGAGAHSFLLAGDYGLRCSNIADIEEYAASIKRGKTAHSEISQLSRDDAMSEFMFLGLRMADGVNFKAFEQYFQIPLEQVYGEQIEQMVAAGLLELDKDRLRLTRRGMLLSNQVFVAFLA